MVSRADAIVHMFPGAVSTIDFALQDNSDGNGPFIAKWNEALGPQPTIDAVTAVRDQLRADEAAQLPAQQAAAKREAQIQAAMRAFATAAVDNGNTTADVAFNKAVQAGKPAP